MICVVRDVPAQICSACCEAWVHEETLREVEGLIGDRKPTLPLGAPVYDFTARVA